MMTDVQKNIVGAVLIHMSASKVPVTEEMISRMVDMLDKNNAAMFGVEPLTSEEREEVIAFLHASLYVHIER